MGAPPPGTTTIAISQEEKAGIDNLSSMLNMSRDQVVRAWIRCDRNLEWTANYLMQYESGGQQGMEVSSPPAAAPSGGASEMKTEENKEEQKTEENKKMEE
uniref:UV excision repair protein RAD23 n=1 Tax=Lotharella globosa TaxID=91324 RepID=A0A7S3ZG64_9EUKA